MNLRNDFQTELKKVLFLRLPPFLHLKNHHPREAMFPFDIAYSISILKKKDIFSDVIDFWVEQFSFDKIKKAIDPKKYFCLVIDAQIASVELVKQIANYAKSLNIPVVAIGHHATVRPDDLLLSGCGIKYCIIGEVEQTISELIPLVIKNKHRKKISVKGIAYRHLSQKKIVFTRMRALIKNIDILPYPDYEIFNKKGYNMLAGNVKIFGKINWGFILSSRGCPYKCIFCSQTLRQSHGNKFRPHSPRRVYNELKFMQEALGINAVYFTDDVTTFDKKRMEELCGLLIKKPLRIRYVIQTRTDCLTPKLLKKMKMINVDTLTLGIESANQDILKTLKKECNLKKVINILKLTKEIGFYLNLYVMVGCSSETEENVKNTFNLIKRFHPLMIQVAFFTPYLGSPSAKNLRYTIHIPYTLQHYDTLAINLSKIKDEKLIYIPKHFYKDYYLSPNYVVNYFCKRLPYKLFNLKSEFKLILNSLSYLFYYENSFNQP